MLEVKNLHKSYGKKEVLHNINLVFLPGHVYGVVGENGAGKTTLFKCIAGLERHTGLIRSSFSPLKDHLGYLETTPEFMSFITGWEYLKLLCSARMIKTENFEEQNVFNLPLNQYASTYSTGMKKKLALMGVLLRKNDIIILDEPFNGVDIQSNVIIFDIIEELRNLNKTVIISSHIFSTLSETCDEITLLSQGKVIKNVNKEDYKKLEQSMKENILGDQSKRIIIE